MNFPNTLILNGGLFDFDLTFVVQAILFTILALVTTNVFLSPISQQLDERSEFINYTLRKATILLTFGYEKLIDCVGLLTEEIGEMNRQIKITKEYTNSNFEAEITTSSSNSLSYNSINVFLSLDFRSFSSLNPYCFIVKVSNLENLSRLTFPFLSVVS